MATKVTTFPSHEEGLKQRRWVVLDGEGRTLGRMATQVADLLRGKTKPIYSPHVDCGDFVIIVNASKIRLTGNKATDKLYYRHSERPGGLRSTPAGELLDARPDRIVREAVKGMLPRNRLSRRLITKLKVYPGAEHPHGAQMAEPIAAVE
ncbi:MAG: 50S ribosomal protein L13 [Candidatus Binatia bacterium]|nr:50S ribosomal protein L13 [Candidatus Binatia bacterium]